MFIYFMNFGKTLNTSHYIILGILKLCICFTYPVLVILQKTHLSIISAWEYGCCIDIMLKTQILL